MNPDEDQIRAELKTAKAERDRLKSIKQAKRGEYGEARQAHEKACALVEELLEELLADDAAEPKRPMLAAIAAKAREANGQAPGSATSTPPVPSLQRGGDKPVANPPSRGGAKKATAKLAGLELPPVRELLNDLIEPDLHSVEDLGLSIPVLIRVKAAGIKTVGDLAGDKCPHGLEGARIQAKAYIAARVGSPAQTPADAPDSTPGPSNAKIPAPPGVWTDEDVDAALMQALIGSGGTWAPMIHGGATNQEIGNALEGIWPKTRLFISRAGSGTREGFTVACPAGNPMFWIGEWSPGRPPTLERLALLERVRRLLEIPTPHQVAQRDSAAAKASGREPLIRGGGSAKSTPPIPPSGGGASEARGGGQGITAAPASIREPKGGWDSASILNAADDLEVERNALRICGNCRAANPPGVKCPCGSTVSHSVADELMGTRPRRPSPPRKGRANASRRA
jgi:hypothetical protein